MNDYVYLYYDKADGKYCDAIYELLEENSINVWMKSKDSTSKDDATQINDAISSAKCFLLLISKNNQKTNQIITEVDLAFSKNVPIVAFNIDGTELEGNLEFILENQEKIPAYPYTKKQLKELVKKTSEIIQKQPGNVKLDSECVDLFKEINPKRKENLIKNAIVVAVPLAIILVLIYLFVIVPTGQYTTDDGVFTMNITGVDVTPENGEYKYIVYGNSYNLPANSEAYFMNIKFLDKDDNLVYEVNSTADEFKSGKIWSGSIGNDNADHIDFKLFDINDKLLSNESYVIHK